MKKLALVASLALVPMFAACGDDGGSTPAVDAPVAASNVEDVTCAGGEMTIDAVNGTNAFMPTSVTIAVGAAVKFTMPSTHSVVPDTGNDENLKVPFSATKCLKFKAAGTYAFHCNPHAFKGTVVVQ